MAARPHRPPNRPPRRPGPGPASAARGTSPARPLNERELDELQALLDTVPSPLEPLDVSALDGFLCGVLVQPQPVPASRWWPHVIDADGRAAPAVFDATRIHHLVLRRHAELALAISQRRWFDPWVFEMSAAGVADDLSGEGTDDADDEGDDMASMDAVYPWVAGMATALELFPALTGLPGEALIEPLALLYRHLDPDDLEDADDLLAEIETLEPPADLAEAVEGLVRATLLLADAAGVPARPT